MASCTRSCVSAMSRANCGSLPCAQRRRAGRYRSSRRSRASPSPACARRISSTEESGSMASASGVFGFSFRGVSEGKFMTHGVFTIVTEVLDGHEPALRQDLDRIQRDHSATGVIPFSDFKGLHFSSLTLFPPYPDVPSPRWLLVFEHAVDGH